MERKYLPPRTTKGSPGPEVLKETGDEASQSHVTLDSLTTGLESEDQINEKKAEYSDRVTRLIWSCGRAQATMLALPPSFPGSRGNGRDPEVSLGEGGSSRAGRQALCGCGEVGGGRVTSRNKQRVPP